LSDDRVVGVNELQKIKLVAGGEEVAIVVVLFNGRAL
jgi:hypothetical protein